MSFDQATLRIALVISLVISLPVAFGATARTGNPRQSKVHPKVLEQAKGGPVEFLLVLEEQADLSPADGLRTKAERGSWVVETLRETASRSQAPLLEWLGERGVEHRAFWIANLVWVRAEREVLETLAQRADVRRIDANPRVALQDADETPADGPPLAIEWNIAQVRADQVWAMGYDGKGIVVAGQDTGYEWDHPALRNQYRGWDGSNAKHDYNWHDAVHSGGGVCGADSLEPCDDNNHGTHTMGTIAGDDGGGNGIGMSPGATWIGCRNMDETAGTPATYTECFQWFVAPTDTEDKDPDPTKAPHVISNSWVCPPEEGCSPDTLRSVVENTRAAGIVVVVGAGNDGGDCGSVQNPPSTYETALSVGATDSSDQIASFSSRGPVTVDGSGRLKPDVSAPGVGVRSSIRNGQYASLSGTSMATPHVAGLTALLLDARPDLIGRVAEVEELIRRSAQPLTSGQECGGLPGTAVPNNTFGFGRIDAMQTLTGDVDDDGTDNLDDCLPVDANAWSVPTAVTDLLLSHGDETVLAWSPPAVKGARTVHYDVLRAARLEDFSDPTCIESNIDGTGASDEQDPQGIFFYLVRVTNPCGAQSGTGSGGNARVAGACP